MNLATQQYEQLSSHKCSRQRQTEATFGEQFHNFVISIKFDAMFVYMA